MHIKCEGTQHTKEEAVRRVPPGYLLLIEVVNGSL